MQNLGAVILAAGGSTRLGQPKQFLQWEGESLIRRVVRAASEAGCARVAVVAGDASARLQTELLQTASELVTNPHWERGLGTSVCVGVQHLLDSSEELEGILLLVCDQPFVDGALLSALIAEWKSSSKAIVASRYANTLGVPALFDRSCFTALRALPDESGAKALIQVRAGDVAEVEFERGAIDIDTPADLALLRSGEVELHLPPSGARQE